MPRPLVAPALALVGAVLVAGSAGCGGSGGGGSAGGGSGEHRPPHMGAADRPRDPAAVIRAWADDLRAGKVEEAVALFAVPSVVANGTPPRTLRSRAAVRAFNAGLPCGARVTRTGAHHGYVLAEFVLVERRGPGADCAGGVGAHAGVAFRIRGGRIVEWRRFDPGATPGGAPGQGGGVTV